MVILTDRARVALKSVLSQSLDEAGVGLRLDVSEEGGLALFPDTAKEGDEVVEDEGDVLLLIGDDVSQPLQGATIDLTDTPEGARLVVTRPPFHPNGDMR